MTGPENEPEARRFRRGLRWSLGTASLMVVGKTILGQLSGYAALLADAVENAGTNVAATLTTLLADWRMSKPPDRRHTAGRRNLSAKAALLNGLSLGLATAWVGYDAAADFAAPGLINIPLAAGAAAASLLANSGTLLALGATGGPVLRHLARLPGLRRLVRSRGDGDPELSVHHQSVVEDARADLVNAGVLLGGLVLDAVGVHLAPPVAALIIAAKMGWTAQTIVREGWRGLLGRPPKGLDPNAVAEAIAAHPGVAEVGDLEITDLGDGRSALLTGRVRPRQGLTSRTRTDLNERLRRHVAQATGFPLERLEVFHLALTDHPVGPRFAPRPRPWTQVWRQLRGQPRGVDAHDLLTAIERQPGVGQVGELLIRRGPRGRAQVSAKVNPDHWTSPTRLADRVERALHTRFPEVESVRLALQEGPVERLYAGGGGRLEPPPSRRRQHRQANVDLSAIRDLRFAYRPQLQAGQAPIGGLDASRARIPGADLSAPRPDPLEAAASSLRAARGHRTQVVEEINLDRADARGVDLSGRALRLHARGADLTGANLSGTVIVDLDIDDSTLLREASIDRGTFATSARRAFKRAGVDTSRATFQAVPA